MNMKFYMTPGSCTTGIHILLEELELVFEAHIVNIPKGDNKTPEYLKINPKGTIPTLVLTDGTALTEYQSIAYYLARSYPKANLLPEGPLSEAKVIGIMAYVVSTIHGQGFARIFAPDTFQVNQTDEQAVKEKGKEIVIKGFETIDKELEKTDFEKNGFNIADAALFYVEFWADKINIPLPYNCQTHYNKMLQRPVVKQVLREEGYN